MSETVPFSEELRARTQARHQSAESASFMDELVGGAGHREDYLSRHTAAAQVA